MESSVVPVVARPPPALKDSLRTWPKVDTLTLLYTTLLDPWNTLSILAGNSTGYDGPIYVDYPHSNHEIVGTFPTLALFSEYNYKKDDDEAFKAINWDLACSKRDLLFYDWWSLQQCLTLAVLTLTTSTFPNLNATVQESIQKTLSTFSITNYEAFNGVDVLNATYECATSGLQGDFDGTFPPFSDFQIDSGKDVSWAEIYSNLLFICDSSASVQRNPDIFGPGVNVSYMIQASIAIYLWIFIRLMTIRRTITSFRDGMTYMRGPRGKSAYKRFPSRFQFSTHLPQWETFRISDANKSILPHFQEAQAFFIVSTYLTLIYARTQPASMAGLDNWSSLIYSRNTIPSIILRGVAPVIVVQLLLRRIHADFLYSLILTTIAMVLAVLSSTISMDISPLEVYTVFRGQNPSPACGGLASLSTYCLDPGSYTFNNEYNTALYVVAGFVGLLWVNKGWRVMATMEWFEGWTGSLSKARRSTLHRVHYAATKLTTGFLLLAEMGLIGFLCWSFYEAKLYDMAFDTWNIGQIIAVLIWAPMVSKYLYLLILGIEEGFKARISPDFEVRRKTTETTQKDSESTIIPHDQDGTNDNNSSLWTLPPEGRRDERSGIA